MRNDAQSRKSDVYRSYDAAVLSLYGGNPNHKRVAQGLARGLPQGLRDTQFISKLFECFASDRWQSPTSSARSNYLWRTADTDHSDKRAEVKLEREIVNRGGSSSWTFQMSTMSGIFEARTHQRRAIDLVHRLGAHEFALIELKIGSNNPAFAAFEILGYGLAYLHARRHADVHSSPSPHDVLRAGSIKLVVLAPSDRYEFNLPRGPKQRFMLKELSLAFNASLEHLRVQLGLPDLNELTFQFRQFKDEQSLLAQIEVGEMGGTLLLD